MGNKQEDCVSDYPNSYFSLIMNEKLDKKMYTLQTFDSEQKSVVFIGTVQPAAARRPCLN
jgi:hypothetical protein